MKTMKFIYRNILILSTLMLAASCVDKISDADILAGRDKTTIEVSYALAGTEVRSLTVASASVKKTIEVMVNNENLKWNLESNRDWCVVVPEEHRGSGSVTLSIAANEDFESREPATLTFVAGDYRGFEITVNQNATAFIIGQPYFISGIEGGTYNVNVTTVAGTEWDFEADSWMEVTKGASSSADYTTTTLTINASANEGTSRYGSIKLSAGEETGSINIYQFGSEFTYDESGNIVLDGTQGVGFAVTAPAYIVDNVVTPKFAKATVTENEDGTSTVDFVFNENLSDCSQARQVELSLNLSNASASVVQLPAMVQDYIPANGLVTGNGMVAFAKAVAEGRPTTDWEDNGVVTVKGEIDMSDVEGWTGIGTAASPFKGQFNGGKYEITNLKNTSVGLFGYCEAATIQNVVLGKGCSLYNDKEFSGLEGAFGGIVSVAKESKVTDCQFDGALDFAGTNDNDEPAFVGGIVGYADEKSTVTKSKMTGNVTVSTGSAQMLCQVGGVVGMTEGTVTANEMTGDLKFSSGISHIVAGGITSSLPAKTVVSNNSFMGKVTLGGSSSNVILGGLYGSVGSDRNFDNVSDKSVTLGNISIDSFAGSATTEVFAGGFIGKAEADVALSFKGYECQTNISLDQKTSRTASYVCLGGVLGGTAPSAAAKSLSFDTVSNSGVISTAYNGTQVTSLISRCFIGGIAGFINGDASFKSCINNAEIGKVLSGTYSASSKWMAFVYGGVAGVVLGGDAEFASCENKADITMHHYSNCAVKDGNDSKDGWYTVCTGAGILGAFDNKVTSVSKKLKMTSCVNSGGFKVYRGMAAGVVGFARNAEIVSCSNSGTLSQNTSSNSPHKGGIAGWLMNSEVKNCVAKCDVYAATSGGNGQQAGGILSIARGGGVKITGCSYYGNVTVQNSGTPLYGGVVAVAEADTVIDNCKFGGQVNGVEVSANNVESLAVGNGLGTISNITLWDGTL